MLNAASIVATVYTVDTFDMVNAQLDGQSYTIVYDRPSSCSKMKNFHGTGALVD